MTGDGGPFSGEKNPSKGEFECSPACHSHSHRIDIFLLLRCPSAHEQLCISYVVSGPLNGAIFLCCLSLSLPLSRDAKKSHGCQMAIATFLDRMCLALRA